VDVLLLLRLGNVSLEVAAIEEVGLAILETANKGGSERGVQWGDLQSLKEEKLLDRKGFKSFLFCLRI